jgi:hypothetical protein
MKLEELRHNLQEVCKEYNLPYDELNREFEIIDNFYSHRIIDNYLRNIRRRMVDAFYSFINYLHNFLAPNPQSLIFMQEAEFFSDAEKDEIDLIIKKIMLINRISVKLELEAKPEKDAEFIRKYLEEWKSLKPRIIRITNNLIKNWEKNL